MDSPTDFSSSMIYINVGLLVVFVVLLSIVTTSGLRLRKAARQMLSRGYDFADDVNTGKISLYYCYKGRTGTLSSFGKVSRPPYFVNENDSDTEILTGTERELLVSGLTPDSTPPSRAYQIAVANVDLKREDSEAVFVPHTLQVRFRPARNCISKWTVAKVEGCELVLEHPLMGSLRLASPLKKAFTAGQQIKLVSQVAEEGIAYRLTYELID